jgi:hypothetical protein
MKVVENCNFKKATKSRKIVDFLKKNCFFNPNYLQTWRKYDTDHSGFIETEELKVRK